MKKKVIFSVRPSMISNEILVIKELLQFNTRKQLPRIRILKKFPNSQSIVRLELHQLGWMCQALNYQA